MDLSGQVANIVMPGILSEICYRFNRRFWEKEFFDRLVHACVPTGAITYSELVSTEEKP